MSATLSRVAARLGERKDTSWVRDSVLPRYANNLTPNSHYHTDASLSFYDTTPGGNRSVNPLPQFTRTADIKMPTLAPDSHGMGRCYYEGIELKQRRLFLQFGVPEYNSLSSFLGNFFNPHLATLVNRGENTGIVYSLVKGATFLLTLPLQAFFGVVSLYKKTQAFLTDTPYTKFYYMKQTMPLYWNAVQIMFNQFVVETGFANPSVGKDAALDSEAVKTLTSKLPDIFKGGRDELNGVDIFAIATRGQRIANAYHERMDKLRSNSSSDEEYRKKVQSFLRKDANPLSSKLSKNVNYGDYINKFMTGDIVAKKPIIPPSADGKTKEFKQLTAKSPGMMEMLDGELAGGSNFLVLNVDVGPGSVSVSSSTKASSLEEKLNGANKQAKDMRVSMAEGNLFGDWQKKILQMGSDATAAALDTVGLGGIKGLAGESFVDIPDVWDETTTEFGKFSFKIKQQTPYGNNFSILMHIFSLISFVYPAAAPRSTGKHAYNSPFLCRAFCEGICDIKLGMITDLSITPNTGNIVVSDSNLPTGVEIDMTVTNLDKIMTAPVTDKFGLDLLLSPFDEDTPLSDWISVLSGTSLLDKYYLANRIPLAWSKTVTNFNSMFSAGSMANWAASTVPGKAVSAFYRMGDL